MDATRGSTKLPAGHHQLVEQADDQGRTEGPISIGRPTVVAVTAPRQAKINIAIKTRRTGISRIVGDAVAKRHHCFVAKASPPCNPEGGK
jgi:hypothetical protein